MVFRAGRREEGALGGKGRGKGRGEEEEDGVEEKAEGGEGGNHEEQRVDRFAGDDVGHGGVGR